MRWEKIFREDTGKSHVGDWQWQGPWRDGRKWILVNGGSFLEPPIPAAQEVPTCHPSHGSIVHLGGHLLCCPCMSTGPPREANLTFLSIFVHKPSLPLGVFEGFSETWLTKPIYICCHNSRFYVFIFDR